MCAAPSPAELPELSSSDIALRYRAPYCVANRWRLTATYIEEPGEKLKRRFAFLETALRYLVAVLAAEHAARGLDEVKSWSVLTGSLDGRRISLGLWRDAARDLSVRVLESQDCILEPVARVLAERPARGRVRAAPVCEQLDLLLKLRNEDAHPDAVPSFSAAALLKDTEAPFRAFLGALRGIGELPPWVVTRLRYREGAYEVEAVCLRGSDLPPERTLGVAAPIEEGRPFVVAADGRILYLSPFLAWGAFPDRSGRARPPELRLFKGWSAGPLYSDPVGMDDAERLGDRVAGAPNEWLRVGPKVVEGALVGRPESLRALRSPDRAEAPPVVPNYEILEPLGFGGNGRVYLARSCQRGDLVAVKVLPSSLTADHAGHGRLRREFELMSRIRHPNVAQVYDYVPDTQSGPALVMEHVAGENLRARVGRQPMPVREAVQALEGILAGLAAAHAGGVVHRDVTPENVLLEPSGNVKLIDFGIAVAPDSERVTRTLDGIGKRNFAAPEQINPSGSPEPTADVYACAKLLGYLVSGSVNRAEQHAALPGALQAVVRRATAEDPAERYRDARELLSALERARAAGWEGPPVQPGDRLSRDYEVSALGRSLGGGLWQVDLLDVPEGARWVGVVAERRPAAEENLRRALRALPPATKNRLGHPDVREKDGLQWCLLRVPSVDAIGGVFAPGGASPDESAPEPAPDAPPREALALPEAQVPPHAPEHSTDARGRPRWAPPPPAETGEAQLSRGLLPAGPLGLLSVLFVPTWPLLLFRALVVLAGHRIPPASDEPLPPYLPALRRFGKIADPGAVARALDTLALVVAIQRVLRGAEPGDEATLRELYADPLRLSWPVLRLPETAHVAEHRRALAAPTARLAGLAAVRTVHAALQGGAVSIPPNTYRRVNKALVMLHRLAHAGASGLPAGQVEAWMARVMGGAGERGHSKEASSTS